MIKGVIYEVAMISNVKEGEKIPVCCEGSANKPQLDIPGFPEMACKRD